MTHVRNALVLVVLTFASYAAVAQEIVYPRTPFDANLAKAALAKGTSTVEGVFYYAPKNGFGIQNKSKMEYGSNLSIDLYPMTPHVQEWYEMIHNKWALGGRKRVKMGKDAVPFCLTTTADEDGNFRFTEIRPGRYLVTATMTWVTQYSNVYTGDAYENSVDKRFYEIVDVTADGQRVKIKLTN